MKFHRMLALSMRHLYLIKGSFPRILDLIYWPTIQIILWGFISQFFTMYSDYYNNTIGVILSCAILYDFLFRSSISFNMLFLEEIWSRNFTNLFIAPLKLKEIILSLIFTALIRTLIGLVPAIILTSPLFGVSIFKLGLCNSLKSWSTMTLNALGAKFSLSYPICLVVRCSPSIKRKSLGHHWLGKSEN